MHAKAALALRHAHRMDSCGRPPNARRYPRAPNRPPRPNPGLTHPAFDVPTWQETLFVLLLVGATLALALRFA
ncbi:MAG: hypothetical protein ACYDBQ_05300 [Thermoplasmatota archaeon]